MKAITESLRRYGFSQQEVHHPFNDQQNKLEKWVCKNVVVIICLFRQRPVFAIAEKTHLERTMMIRNELEFLQLLEKISRGYTLRKLLLDEKNKLHNDVSRASLKQFMQSHIN